MPRGGDLADLQAFAAVAEHRSFRLAATQLGVTPSALSHAIRQMEERLGVRLLHRTTRSVSVTDAGLRLLTRLRPALEQITGALGELDQERARPYGRLRVYATQLAASAVIAPVWDRFLSTYPDVQLEVQVSEASADIVARGFDAGIGPQDRVSADMTTVRVKGPMKVAVVGSAAYFARNSRPRTPDDLSRHRGVQYRRADGSLYEWPFERAGQSRTVAVTGPVIVNHPELAVRAAVDGLGIAYTIEAIAEPFLRSGQLVRVLEEWTPSFEGLFMYYPGHRQVPAGLRALIDIIREGGEARVRESVIENPFAAG